MRSFPILWVHYHESFGSITMGSSNPRWPPQKNKQGSSCLLASERCAPSQRRTNTKSATIVDGMHLVEKIRGDQTTFGEIARSVFHMALREGSNSQRIDVVFDTYREMSIKSMERSSRGEERRHQLQSISATQLVRQWRSSLSLIQNKNSLISFLVSEWRKEKYTKSLSGKVLFVK